MNDEFRSLAEESGSLCAVTGLEAQGGGFTALRLEFENGVLEVTCDDDTDEVKTVVSAGDEQNTDGMGPVLPELLNLRIEYAWELRNHRGYLDGLQLRLRDGHGREETVQLEVLASALDVRRVT